LDEPTIGLDVVAKERIRQFIRHINQERSTTVVLTTHDLSDVEKLCQRVLVIDEGRLLYDGQLETLADRFGGARQLIVELADDYPSAEIEGAEVVIHKGRRVTYQFARHSMTASELIGRISDLYRIRDLEVREPALEETIRRIYEEGLLN
jgi:ABC-2 type transport system ATP-binding protein